MKFSRMPRRPSRLSLVLCALVMALSMAQARQPGAVGLTYNYATEYRQHGLGAKLQLGVDNHWRIEPELVYFGEKHDVTTLMLNANVHYVQPVMSRMSLYPFVGMHYGHWGYDGPNASRWGVNLGAGMEVDLGRNWMALGELRFTLVSSETQAVTALGIKYLF